MFQIFTRSRNSVTPAIQDHFDSINATPNYCEEALPYLLALKQQNSDNYVESNICIISLQFVTMNAITQSSSRNFSHDREADMPWESTDGDEKITTFLTSSRAPQYIRKIVEK